MSGKLPGCPFAATAPSEIGRDVVLAAFGCGELGLGGNKLASEGAGKDALCELVDLDGGLLEAGFEAVSEGQKPFRRLDHC